MLNSSIFGPKITVLNEAEVEELEGIFRKSCYSWQKVGDGDICECWIDANGKIKAVKDIPRRTIVQFFYDKDYTMLSTKTYTY